MLPRFLYSVPLLAAAAAVTFTVPERVGAGGYAYTPLDPSPIGISFEFFAFPAYFTDVPATNQCLLNWKQLTGVWPPIRIGGTTQDRASYDAASAEYVEYSVASAADAPRTLTFGPQLMALAGTYGGSVVMGLNRGKNNLANTISAARMAVSQVKNLLAIELGNEPEYWKSDRQPIARGTWNPSTDAASQNQWDAAVGAAVGKANIIQAGNWNSGPATWGAARLIETENSTVRDYVSTYAHHNYPGGSVANLMDHARIVKNIRQFDADVAAAQGTGKQYVLGETNSVSGGGAANVSPTFGAALWTMDYSLRATYSNISRTYFHHGTIGNCKYCFWGRYSMGSPYYGAYAAAAFLAGAAHLTALDAGSATYAGYASFDSNGTPLRVLLYNSEYYAGRGERRTQDFVLTGLKAGSVKTKRLTASSAMSRQDQGDAPSFGGQYFTDGTCVISGTEAFGEADVSGGSATFTLKATEALLVYLQ